MRMAGIHLRTQRSPRTSKQRDIRVRLNESAVCQWVNLSAPETKNTLCQPKTNTKRQLGPQKAAQGSHTQVGAVEGETQKRVRPSGDHETNTFAPIGQLARSRCACVAARRAMDFNRWSSVMSVFQRYLEVRPHFVSIYSGATICRSGKCLGWRLMLSTPDPARRDGELWRLEI